MWRRRAIDCATDAMGIADLISAAWGESGPQSEMHVGDLFWALFSCSKPSFRPECLLWESRNELNAFAMLSPRGWCDCVVSPSVSATQVLPELLEQLDSSASRRMGLSRIRFGRRVQDGPVAALLESDGYERMQFGFPTLQIELGAAQQEAVTPDGFQIVTGTPLLPAINARVNAWNSAFPDEPRDAGDVDTLVSCCTDVDALDLYCITSEGTVAAFCTVWLDRPNRCGLFEPVGCKAEFQRRGLSRALVSEACHRLKAAGAENAYVRVHSENQSALRFYEACGFRVVSTEFGFEKQLTDEE